MQVIFGLACGTIGYLAAVDRMERKYRVGRQAPQPDSGLSIVDDTEDDEGPDVDRWAP